MEPGRAEPVTDVSALLTVDRNSPVPLYFQVAEGLQRLIHTDALPVRSRLTNEIEMADNLGVSRPKMRRAIQYLVDRGQLVRRRGVGTQVVRTQVNRSLELTNGTHIRVADQTIGAAMASTAEAKLLGERKGAELLTMREDRLRRRRACHRVRHPPVPVLAVQLLAHPRGALTRHAIPEPWHLEVRRRCAAGAGGSSARAGGDVSDGSGERPSAPCPRRR